jgi:predicted PurR-regulated permease PerM
VGKATAENSLWSVFQNRWVKLVLAVVLLYALYRVAYALQNILVSFGLAVIAAYVFNPVVEYLDKRWQRWSRTTIVLVLVGALTVVVVAVLSAAIYYAVVSVDKVVKPAAERALAEGRKPDGLWGRVEAEIENLPVELRAETRKFMAGIADMLKERFSEIVGSVAKGAGAIFGAVVRFLLRILNFVLFFVVTAYLLIDLPRMREGASDLLPDRYRDDILRVLHAIDNDVHAFFRGQLVVALALGVIYSVGLLICGVDFALLIGMVAGLANIVPYLGFWVGIVPALAFAFVPYVGLLRPIGVVVVFSVGQTIESFYLTPKIVGKNVGMNPVTVILAILIFGQLFGFLGIIFAVPLASAVRVLLRELIRYYKDYQKRMAAEEAE